MKQLVINKKARKKTTKDNNAPCQYFLIFVIDQKKGINAINDNKPALKLPGKEKKYKKDVKIAIPILNQKKS